MNKKYKKRINDFLDIPSEIISNEPKITILGFEKIMIENYKNIIEYEDFYIRLNTFLGVININGINLRLIHMTEDDLMVIGKIDSIDFENVSSDEKEV